MVFEMLMSGLAQVVAWPAIGYMMLGVLIGVVIGAVPGLSGITGLVLILPFTFGMDPVPAFAMLLGAYAVTATGDTITSVLLGVPGTAAAQATIVDGYPLAKRGEAGRALGAAYTSSMLGGILGGVFMAVALPLIVPIILQFGMPEFFLLAILGLTMVGSLSGRSLMKGLGAAAIGLIFATVGYAPVQAIPRYSFGSEYLYSGLPLLPVVLGIFGVPELIELASKRLSISDIPREQSAHGGVLQGIKDTFRHWWLVIRSSAIGVYVGIVPGIGGSVADWFAYSHAVRSTKDKSQFGKGDIRGVIAPEAANNSVRGGDLIPTVAFGIPGSAGNAVLLSALLIHGLRPGTSMLVDQLDFTFTLVWTLIIANIAAALLLMACTNQIAKLVFVPSNLLVPGVVVLIFMGAFMESVSIGDWITLFLAGLLGLWLKQAGWPRPPVVLAMVLGPITEQALRISLQAHGAAFLLRPIALLIAAFIVATLLYSLYGYVKRVRAKAEKIEAGDGFERNPLLSLFMSVFGLAVFIGALALAQEWPRSVKQFPQMIAIAAIVIFAGAVFNDWRESRAFMRTHGGFGAAVRAAASSAGIVTSLPIIAWFAGIIVCAIVIGQEITLMLFVLSYLLLQARVSWQVWVPYIFGAALVIFGLYDRLVHVYWYRPLIPLRQMIGF